MRDLSTRRIAVLGAGAWGTALALAIARNGSAVTLWARDPGLADTIDRKRANPRYLPGLALDPGQGSLRACADLAGTLAGAETVLLVTPAQSFSALAPVLAGLVDPQTPLVTCAKGIDRSTGQLPGEVLGEAMPQASIAALSGPSFAADVARGLPTAVSLACPDIETAGTLAAELSSPAFRLYATDDMLGVELGGALKNVMALAVGAARGMALGASAEAALVARGFAEMARLCRALGARPSTLTGLSGLGDLVLTCSSPQSRNFSAGMALGRGEPLEGRPLAEGIHTAAIAAQIGRDARLETPIINAVTDVLERQLTAREAVARLLDRPLRNEGE